MDFLVFAFAFFVFILVCLLILIIARVTRPAKVKEDPVNDKEKRLFKLYQNLEDMMNSIEEYVEEARKEFSEDKIKMNALLEKAIQIQKGIIVQDIKLPEEQAKTAPAAKPKEESAPGTLRNMKKNDLVYYMKQEGLDDDKIAKELGISRGEVALILGMKR